MLLKAQVQILARQEALELLGVASTEPFSREAEVALKRLDQGLMDGLPWFHEERVRRGADPQRLLSGAKSILSFAVSYYVATSSPGQDGQPLGRVARYAWGMDYHQVLKGRLKVLIEKLSACLGRVIRYKVYVDDGPMLDRAVAYRAGVGWYGKNTNILTRRLGSWVFLAQVLTDLELEPDTPLRKSCGRCRACIPACPTGAIVAPYVVDNRRCISYHTIENRGVIPREIRPLMGDWVFGCDLCQEICPVNRRVAHTKEPAFQPREGFTTLGLFDILALTEEDFQGRFRGSPIRRATRVGLQRNACIALGNISDTAAVPALARALREGAALVRGHAAWALGLIGGAAAQAALEEALQKEHDPWVQEEATLALASASEMVQLGPALARK
ncbi:MAG: tRNA epoxyqueuosine(34) reductase QueG [Chloroflexi bacterium]|nr:tRNA epoxyqueuosine(34) reductase QueG [Chloroflexota bacterium]